MRIDDAAGAVLAGGRSSRMGREKAGIVLAGESLLDRATRTLASVFPEVLVVGREAVGGEAVGGEVVEGEAPAGARYVADEKPGLGPLGGIATALAASAKAWVFVAACDMPFLNERIIARLWELAAERPDALAVAPMLETGSEPLAAFYHAGALARAREAVSNGKLPPGRGVSARSFLERIGAAYLEVAPGSPEARALVNINTEDDLRAAMRETEAERDATRDARRDAGRHEGR